MARPKVLIVDDSPADAGRLRRYIASQSLNEYHVLIAETGEEGLDLAAEFRPDVVLLDFELPDLNGLEFLQELPARLPPNETPPVVLAVTGQSDPRVAAELIRSGAEDYISKAEATAESVRLAVRQGTRTRALRQALAERARERQRSHDDLLASLERASRVARFSEALSRSLSLDAVVEAVGDLAVPWLADVCFVDLVEPDSRLVRRAIRAAAPFDEMRARATGRVMILDAHEGPAKVLRSATSASYAKSWLPSLARWDPDADAALSIAPLESAIVVPLVFDGVGLGAITLLSQQKPDPYAQDVAEEFGRRAAAALTNARTFEAERAAKQASEEARRRLSTLSQISELFSRSLEWRETLREMIDVVVPSLADYASISLLEGGEPHVVASSTENLHLRPAPVPANRRAEDLPQYYPDVTLMRRYSDAGRSLDALGGEDGGSFIHVPIVAPTGTTTGDLVLATGGTRRLTLDDMGLAEDIGHRIGLYVETARAFERERDIARSLQRSLLPAGIPMLPGVLFAARCVAGVSGVDVGGDWYDIVPLRGGNVAFAVGDVAGRGLLAAATMGQLRSSLRAYLLEGLSPAEALARLNAFILSQEQMQYATVVLGLLHCADGSVKIASAGHLAPLLVGAGGKSSPVRLQPSLPVGVFADQQFTQTELRLGKGESLVCFSDGLVESRWTDIETGVKQLRRRLSQSGRPDDLLHAAFADLPSDPADDVTCLALRYLGVGAESIQEEPRRLLLTMPSVPQSASRVRRHLQKFCESAGVGGMRSFDLQLAVGEAVANAIEHAYGGSDGAIFSVYARVEENEAIVDVLDQGRWREGVPTPRGQLSERGRGVGLMRALCDRVRIDRTLVGTRIQLGLALDEPQAGGALG